MPVLVTTRSDARPDETRGSAPAQRIIAVEFRSDDGRRWTAIGGGPTVPAAIAEARGSCPPDTIWSTDGWNDLYGD